MLNFTTPIFEIKILIPNGSVLHICSVDMTFSEALIMVADAVIDVCISDLSASRIGLFRSRQQAADQYTF